MGAQNGYDIDLTSLTPRGGRDLSTPGSTSSREPSVFTLEPRDCLTSRAQRSSNGSTDYRAHLASIPPISTPNPRFAALAYSQRAHASETNLRGDAEKLFLVGGRGETRRRRWHERRGLVFGAILLIFLVCASIGVGVGVGVGVMRGHNDPDQQLVATSTSPASSFAASVTSQTVAPTHSPDPVSAYGLAPTASVTSMETSDDDSVAAWDSASTPSTWTDGGDSSWHEGSGSSSSEGSRILEKDQA